LSYPAAALLISWMWRRAPRGFSAALLSAAIGNIVILVCGALWLATFLHLSASAATSLAILPFLPGDALKVIAAAAIATGFQRMRRRSA
jgi:biotin transport system substrate-specific component